MKLPLFLLSLFLAVTFSGCFHAANDSPQPKNTNSINAALPVISLFQEEKEYAGAEGSYCYKTTCVDKISPAQIIEDEKIPYTEVSTESFSARTNIASTGATVDVFTKDMELVSDCDTPITVVSDTEYTFPLCDNLQGEYIIGIIGDFDDGDMSYYFPVSIE